MILTALAAFVCTLALAVPARPGYITFTQPDGTTIRLQRHGDEFFHWLSDASGRVYEKDADGFYREASATRMEMRRSAANIRREAVNRMRRSAPAKGSGHIAVGQKHFLVILVEFKDLSFKSETANADFAAMLNENGYSDNGGTGSARDYYYDNSHGYFEPLFDVYGPVKLENAYAYYGGNDNSGDDKNPEKAVSEGCKGLDAQIDFTQYDNDGDGAVDLVFMYYAGYGEADSDDEDSIWPHQWELSDAGISLTLDGKTIDRYACSNELVGYGAYEGKMEGIGTVCHEFGHAIGLPDFYDTDYGTNGQAAGMFFFSLMDSGSYNNEGRTPPYLTMEERILLGWLGEDAIKTFSKSGPVTLPSVNENIAYKTMTDTDGEYFVYECRDASGWDAGLEAHGLVVTHVDKSSRSVKISGGSSSAYNLWANWQSSNSINESGSHPCCYVIPAADPSNLKYGYVYLSEYGAYYFDPYGDGYSEKIPFPGASKVTSYTAKSWNGVDSEVTLSGISYTGGVLSFTANVPSPDIDYTVIANPKGGVYQVGDNFALELVQADARPVKSVSWYFDDEPVSDPSVTLRSGAHTIEAQLTLKDGTKQILTLEISVD